MRIAVPHSLPRDEVRRRMHDRAGDLTGLLPGAMAQVSATWPDPDRMDLAVTALGKAIAIRVEIEDTALAFTVELPDALSFAEPLIRGAIEDKGRKLLG